MIEALNFSATAILPILLMCAFGYALKRVRVLSEETSNFLHKLVFRAALPALIFLQIYQMEFSAFPKSSYLLFCVISMTLCYGGGLLVCAVTIKDRKKAGAMAQAMTRSTFSIVGLPLAGGLFGDAGLQLATLLLPIVIIFNNVFAVLMLSVLNPDRHGQNLKKTLVGILLGIVKNPLIIGMILALLVKLINVTLPSFLMEAVTDFSAVAQPLALLCLGAGFAREGLRGRVHLALIASIVKTLVLPLVFGGLAIILGFRAEELGLVFILFGGPTTISSYIMAKNMGSDEILTGQVVLLSTLMSAFTLFFQFFVLHYIGLV